MPVAYEELEDSPQIMMNRKGGSATRRAKIAWTDIDAFFSEMFLNPFNGNYGSASMPGYPWLVADSISVKPFVEAPHGNNEPINVFDWAEVTVEYRPPSIEGGMQGGAGGDPSGPGGEDGSSGGHQGEDQTFVTHDMDIGGEFLTYPAKHFMWQYPAKAKNPAVAGIEEFDVSGDTIAGTIVPHIEHTIGWHQVQWPPWQAIRQCVGRVNAYRFAGAPRGTMLYLGAKARREWTNQGAKAWTLEHKFSEKNYNTANPNSPRGWNYFLRPDGWRAGQYEVLYRRIPFVDNGGGKLVFPTTTNTNQIGGGTRIINVVNDAQFPEVGQFRIMLRANARITEYMEVIVHNGLNWTVLRGTSGSKIRDWPPGTTIQQVAGFVYDSADFRYLFLPGLRLRA